MIQLQLRNHCQAFILFACVSIGCISLMLSTDTYADKVIQLDYTSQLININTADLTRLTHLHGIGAVKAQAIIDYRNQHGIFKSVDALEAVQGIGPLTIKKNRDRITVN